MTLAVPRQPLVGGRPSARDSAFARAPSAARLVGLWVAAGAMMASQLGQAAVIRSQEARVLETAREMLDAPLEGWLIPQVNGHPRMQKPPLAYWLTAASYKLFGNSGEAAGRAPTVLAAWLTLGLTGAVASRLFGRRAAFFAGAALLGSILFFHHARLGETDILVTLFVTLGCWAVWRATRTGVPRAEAAAWFHAAAAAIGLAAMTKGPPAAYPLLFLLALCAVERRWRLLLTFVLSGAPLTFLLIAAPWFCYVWTHPSSAAAALVTDLRNSVEGGKGHWDWPYVYVYQLSLSVAPWTAALVVAVAAALPRARRDSRLRPLLIWAGVILLPLCVWGNKQRHYLLPLLPPLMIVVGWYVDRALGAMRHAGARGPRILRAIAIITAWMCVATAGAILVVGPLNRGGGRPAAMDVLLATVLVGTAGLSVLAARHRGLDAGIATFAVGSTAVMYVTFVLWGPTIQPVTPRVIAEAIRARYGDAPVAFVRREHLPLCYHLGQIVPVARTDGELAEIIAANPGGLIAIDIRNKDAGVSDARFVEDLRFDDGDGMMFVIGPMKPAARGAVTSSLARKVESRDE